MAAAIPLNESNVEGTWLTILKGGYWKCATVVCSVRVGLARTRILGRASQSSHGGLTRVRSTILGVYTGKLGGPVADLVKLIGEVVSVEKVPIAFDVEGGKGTLKIGNMGFAELEPYKSASGATTTLTDTIFSTVPGAPVYVGKAPTYRAKNEKLGIDLNMSGHNALQSTFVFDA
jgi:hypothetical protein